MIIQKSDFTPEEVKSISSAGAGLLKWVYAIVNYFGVAKTVDPKRQWGGAPDGAAPGEPFVDADGAQ